jgi:hypothetical protein
MTRRIRPEAESVRRDDALQLRVHHARLAGRFACAFVDVDDRVEVSAEVED